MPSKHDPPADSSSSSEEEEEEEAAAVEASQDAEEDEEDDEEEEEEEDPTPLKPSKPTPTSNSTPQKQSQPQPQPDSSDSDESDSDDDETDSPTPTKTKTKTKPQTPAPLDIKPISSKPMPSSSSSAKPQSQRDTVMGLASLSKRPAETDSPRKDKNKKKKKVSDLVDDAEQNDHNNNKKKNNMFQRIWTEEDEIAILKCMISCKKKGMDVLSQPFVDTLKDSLQMKDVSKTQVHSKIRTLKKKFQNASKKPNPGENLKPHDAKVYVLSKKFWNEEIGKDEKVPDAPISRVTTLPNNNNSTKTTTTKEGVKDDGDKKSSLEYMYLSESSVAPKFPMMPVPPLGLGDIVSKKGWDVIGGSKAQKLDRKWRNVIIAETKAYLQRLDLVKEQTQAMLDALESSNV